MRPLARALPLLLLAAACGSSSADIANDELQSADETVTGVESALSSSLPKGASLVTTANLNLRTAASTTAAILRVIPSGSRVTAVTGVPTGGWYQVQHNGLTGWSYGAYLLLVTDSGAPAGNSSARDAAVARAQSGVGFSYWWGHGRWLSSGVSSGTAGACTGNCPSCSHAGSYGADCSGYVAKIWQVPGSNADLASDAHPYSTYSFANEQHGWAPITRASLQKADALVYNSGGAGHIVLYESGDSWGSFWTYEARGCVDGVRHNLRSVSSAFRAIRRAGY